jgi:prepilin-type N-terminal cleavage/methylation domain-containing protein/prepilin-type processing-associated H-X9-DG protein
MSRVRCLERGFSLVELLAVITILALLLAVLLPSLKKVREQGRRVVCAAHLRALATSWEIYTLEFRTPPQLARQGTDINCKCVPQLPFGCTWQPVEIGGFGPQYFNTYLSVNPDPQVWLSAIYHRHHLFQVSNPPPAGPLPGHWWNWGLMWLSGMVQDPRVFFCPSVRDPDFAWNTPLNPWPPSRETMWRPDYPWIVNHTDSSYERRVALTGVLWDRVPDGTMVAHDLAAPNVDRIAHENGANVAYRDGHAEYVRGSAFAYWWADNDSWLKEATHLKLLAFSYWVDRGGGPWPLEARH